MNHWKHLARNLGSRPSYTPLSDEREPSTAWLESLGFPSTIEECRILLFQLQSDIERISDQLETRTKDNSRAPELYETWRLNAEAALRAKERELSQVELWIVVLDKRGKSERTIEVASAENAELVRLRQRVAELEEEARSHSEQRRLLSTLQCFRECARLALPESTYKRIQARAAELSRSNTAVKDRLVSGGTK